MRIWWMGAALALLSSSCQKGTYVIVKLDGQVSSAIARIDLEATLGDRMATTTVTTASGSITLPTDTVLEIGSGDGQLDVSAIAIDANGVELARGHGTIGVTRQEVATVGITLVEGAGSAKLATDSLSKDLGTVVTGTKSGAASIVINNQGTAPSGTLTTKLVGTNAEFELITDDCKGKVLAAGASCTLNLDLAPASAGDKQASLTVSGSPGGMLVIALSGKAVPPGALQVSPSPQDFGSALLGGAPVELGVTVTNSGGETSGAISVAVTGTDGAQFVPFADLCTGKTLISGATCTVKLRFLPVGQPGSRAASLTVNATPGGTGVGALTGKAVKPAALSFAMMSYDFSLRDLGQPAGAVVDFVATNGGGQDSGTMTTTLTGDTTQFVAGGDSCNGQVVSGGGSCKLSFSFKPTSYGSKSMTITLSGTPGGPASIMLTGTGRDYVTVTVTTPFSGNGSGTVTGGGLSCGSTCAVQIARTGASAPTIALTASPGVGSDFDQWTMGCTGTTNPCTLTLDGNKTVALAFKLRTFDLTVSTVSINGAGGTVGRDVAGTSCGANCFRYNANQQVVLTATPTPTAKHYFGGWDSGDCGLGDQNVCTLTMNAPRSAVARFSTANYVFVTSASYTIAQIKAAGTGTTDADKMLDGADKLCNSVAAGKVPGKFKAWLSSVASSALTRFRGPRGWNVFKNDREFGDLVDSSSILGRKTFHAPMFNETGVADPAAFVWTATDETGTVVGQPTFDCVNWASSAATDSTLVGTAGGGSGTWTHMKGSTCDQSNHLLCMGTDYHAVVAPRAPTGNKRYVFYTTGGWNPSTGIAAADNLCATQAAGKLPGTYKALVATNLATAASRFTVRSFPIIRPDGTTVADSDGDLLNATLPYVLAPITQDANGVYSGYIGARTGANNPATAGTTGTTCYTVGSGAWTSSSSSDGGLTGYAGSAALWFNQAIALGCNLPGQQVYCLQE